MVAKRKAVAARRAGGRNLRIPKAMLEEFAKSPIIDLGGAPGYWPIDIGLLRRAEFIKKLINNKQFTKDFEVMIVPRVR